MGSLFETSRTQHRIGLLDAAAYHRNLHSLMLGWIKRHWRWLRWPVFGIPLILAGLAAWAYFAFAWIFFVKAGPAAADLSLPITQAAGSPHGEAGLRDGPGPTALLAKPIRLARDPEGGVVFADINNHAIRRLRPDGSVETLTGGPDRKGHRDGPAADAQFGSPHGVAVRDDGVIAVAEAGNHTIRLLTPEPGAEGRRYLVSTLAGLPGKSGMRDGPNATALFSSPHAVVWSPTGELFVADIGNARIRVITGDTTRTVAGCDRKGADDGGPDTGTLKYPMDLTLDPSGNLWIADAGTLTIRRWSAEAGLTTPFPGLRLAMPHGIAVGADGSVIVAELNGQRVISVAPETGNITTLCGTTKKGRGEGQLNRPAAVLLDHRTLWVADLGNHRLVWVPLP